MGSEIAFPKRRIALYENCESTVYINYHECMVICNVHEYNYIYTCSEIYYTIQFMMKAKPPVYMVSSRYNKLRQVLLCYYYASRRI